MPRWNNPKCGFQKGHNHKHSEETKEKISKSKIGKKYAKRKNPTIFTEEHKRNIGLAKMGHPNWLKSQTKEARLKIGQAQKGNKNCLGHKASDETKRKQSEAHKGEKSYLWQGGKSFEKYSVDWTKTLRRSIRERDHNTCRLCSKPQEDEALDVHHINYIKTDCNPDNLITLCNICHAKTNHNRENWINYFKQTFL